MSPSRTQVTAVQWIWIIAVWQLLLGINPCEHLRHLGSKMALNRSRIASWTSLSLAGAILKERVEPDGLRPVY